MRWRCVPKQSCPNIGIAIMKTSYKTIKTNRIVINKCHWEITQESVCESLYVLFLTSFIYPDDGSKRPKHVAYVKIHSCVGLYLTLYLCNVE